MAVTIQVRRDTAANWVSVNPVLNQGEPGLETDTGRFKYGDGSTAWTSLGYAAQQLTPTTQTTTYTANPGDYVKANISSASWTMKLPNAPAANTIVGAKVIANATGNANTLTVACSGSDKFETSTGGTSTTLFLANQAAAWQYNGGYWTRVSDDLPLGQLDARYTKVFSPLAFGAAGNGTTDDSAAVKAAFSAAFAVNGVVDLGTYTFLTSSAIPIAGPTEGIRVQGSLYFGGGTIWNRTTDVFQITGSAQHVIFENCNLYSLSGGGHIFNAATTGNVSTGPSMSFWRFLGVNMQQDNTGKAIWYQIGGAWIDCLMDQNCYLQCQVGATVSPMSFLAIPGAFNSVQFKRMRCAALGAPVPFFDIDPGWGAHTDTVTISTSTPASVTDSSAVATDLGMFIYATAYPGGSATITAVTPGTGYTVGTSATSNYSGSALVGTRGWDEEISWESVTWEVCTGGAISATGCIDVDIRMCSNWDIPGPRTDTGCSTTNSSTTVTDSSAVSGDLHSAIGGTGIPAGAYITAVAAGTGYTISKAATATNSDLPLVIGGQSANFYSFTKGSTGYPCTNIQVHGGRTGGVTAGTGFYDFYADSNSENILLDSMGQWGTAPVLSSPALQTTYMNMQVTASASAPVMQAPVLAVGGNTGATAASRYAGATAGGAPVSGTYALGDFVVDQTGSMWVCTSAGTPGTWVQVGSASGFASADDPMQAGFNANYNDLHYSTSSSNFSSLGALSAVYMRLKAAGHASSNILISVISASGNISVCYYTNSGTGINSRPTGGQLAASGGIACPAAGVATIALGSSVTPHLADWIAMSCDNTTATFSCMPGGLNTAMGSGLTWVQGIHSDTSCTTQSGASANVVLDGSASATYVGYGISNANIPANTTIVSAVAATSYTISANATAAASSQTCTIGPHPLLSTPVTVSGGYNQVLMKGS